MLKITHSLWGSPPDPTKGSNPFQCYLSLSDWCACMCFVYLHYFYQYILCITQEEFSLIESNQQICDFYKDNVEICEVKFWYQQLFIQWNTNSRPPLSLLNLVCVVCLCVSDIKLQYLIICQISVNLIPYCIKHTARFFWYQGMCRYQGVCRTRHV